MRAALPEADRNGALRPLLGREHWGDAQFHWWKRWDLPPSRHAALRDAALCGTLNLEHYAPHSIPEKRSEVQRRLAAGLPFEEPVEIPLCIETEAWILGIEAVFRSNLRRHTAFDAHRDSIIRLLDAGTWAAGERRPFLSLIVCTDSRTLNVETTRLVERYRGRPERVVEALPHRDDKAALQRAAQFLGSVRWKDLGHALLAAKDEERLGAFDVATVDELVKFLARKDVGFNFFRRLK